MYKVITDFSDPRVVFIQWSNSSGLDSDIKISVGIYPRLSNTFSTMYLRDVESLMTDYSVFGIGDYIGTKPSKHKIFSKYF